MCGIVGFFNIPLGVESRQPLLQRMCDGIRHRGPDGEGYYADDWIGLGMRRLSIIDLSTGNQPMTNEDGSLQIVFNGEIYNFADLRLELEKLGHCFYTRSDTEVILHQYEQDGVECVQRLNGMFAIAVWDKKRRSLFLARDRMGIKPLYYYWDGRYFLFASEIKALLATALVPRHLNLQAMWDYLTFRYVPHPETIWENVYKLLPGHRLTISVDHPEPVVERYWDIPYADDMPLKSPDIYLEEFEYLFLDAVRLHLIADVPVGVFLSGGLDSSSVAAAISTVHNNRLDSFTVAFKDSPLANELPYARQVANHTKTNHHEILIGEKEFLDFLPRLVYFTDEPLADLASVPLYYLSYMARQKVKVVLSGEGSDEILGGYHFDRTMWKWNLVRWIQRFPTWLYRNAFEAIGHLFGGRAREWADLVSIPLERLLRERPFNMTNYLDSRQKSALLQQLGNFMSSQTILLDEAARAFSRHPLHQALYVYCQSWLVEDLLMKADKMTMANSIELRVPFLDFRLVEWAARTPPWVKVGVGRGGRYETKWVLRRFADQRLPVEIINRPKQGFPVPVYDWLYQGLKSWATGLLLSRDTQLYRWFRSEEVRRRLEIGTHPRGKLSDRHILWNLLILELWLREWQPL